LVPSDRVIVPRSLDTAAPPAFTEPVAVTGGHACWHGPEHWDASPVSLAHRYTARPDPSVRIVAPDAVAVVIVVAPEAAPPEPLAEALAVAGAPVAGALVLDELLPLEQAATSRAVPTVATAAAPILSNGDRSAVTLRNPVPILAIVLPGRWTEFLALSGWSIVIVSSELLPSA
jgi:hypothetical protein